MILPPLTPEDQEWDKNMRELATIMGACIGAINCINNAKTIMDSDLFKNSEIVQKVMKQYIESFNIAKTEESLEKFIDFDYDPPSWRKGINKKNPELFI